MSDNRIKSKRSKPARAPSRLAPAVLSLVVVAILFATLMIRLEVVQEGYQLSSLQTETADYREKNRSLRLQVAQLSSQARLIALANKFHMSAPARGQVVVVGP
jgi:cell division protein FtsL